MYGYMELIFMVMADPDPVEEDDEPLFLPPPPPIVLL
jgi:hypothetical protein